MGTTQFAKRVSCDGYLNQGSLSFICYSSKGHSL
jgi:hypothetical protein